MPLLIVRISKNFSFFEYLRKNTNIGIFCII
nr:MAG TPA: hypothetical protein [Caudoviricetes sp.]DAU60551.1 MAG TPA: hypothetical protein [Caudoviricetes sp.]